MALDLNEEEREALRRVLEEYVSDLRMEISNTDRQEFRDELKETEALLEGIASRLDSEES
jgi:ribosome recycling factor